MTRHEEIPRAMSDVSWAELGLCRVQRVESDSSGSDPSWVITVVRSQITRVGESAPRAADLPPAIRAALRHWLDNAEPMTGETED